MTKLPRDLLTSYHWGTYRVDVSDGKVTGLRSFEEDAEPSQIGMGIVDVLDGPTRIHAPMVRKSWLEEGPGAAGNARGSDSFIEVGWDEVNQLVASELNRIRKNHGNQAIFAGSYGWASAGRFHHAQSQLKRFLNCIGGFTDSKNTYSFAAAEVVVPHVLGTFWGHLNNSTSWESIASDCELFVAFGGVPVKNGQVCSGGTGAHVQRQNLLTAREAGVEFINVSPIRSDILDQVSANWLDIVPNTDVALMLGLAYTLLTENLHDQSFLDNYTTGFDKFAAYLTGQSDGVAKSPEWASRICGLSATTIFHLARQMAANRTMISVAWSLTRQDHGEQPYWAAISLAAMLGQIGLLGTGIGFGYSATNNIGLNRQHVNWSAVPQGINSVQDFIPVARIADMLENPGSRFDYNGQSYQYPDIRLIWWAGGNPFHHHQNLNRLRRAWSKPETIIVNEWCWNALAQHADIVLPCTTPLERSDLSLTPKDPYQVVMDQAILPVGKSKDDYEIFRGIAIELGVEKQFTENRNTKQWLQHLWNTSSDNAAKQGITLPDWQSFQQQGWIKIPAPANPTIMMEDFRRDPVKHPLATPSGKIEIFSETIANFRYTDCPGHASWFDPAEWLGRANFDELHMLSNQPANKLHSQLDHGSVSAADRPNGIEPVTMHPHDAKARNLSESQIVRIYNERGSCLADLRISDSVRTGVIQIATGAWFTPAGEMCTLGNPNTLTLDQGTSSLAQGPVAHTCLVRVERYMPTE